MKQQVENKILRNTKIYNNTEELATAIDKAFAEFVILTKHQLNQVLGISKQLVYEWKKSITPEINTMHNYVMQAYNFIESNLAEGAVLGTYNAYMVKFVLNSQFQWRENAPINNESKVTVINTQNSSDIDLGK